MRVPIVMRMTPPIISARDQMWCENFFPNSTPMYDTIKVVIPIVIAGNSIDVIFAVSDTQTASASMLVASQSVRSDRREKIFFSTQPVSSHFHHAYIIFPPIYARRKNAIQWS